MFHHEKLTYIQLLILKIEGLNQPNRALSLYSHNYDVFLRYFQNTSYDFIQALAKQQIAYRSIVSSQISNCYSAATLQFRFLKQ